MKRQTESQVRLRIQQRLDELKHYHPIFWTSIVGHVGQRSGLPDIRVVFYGLSVDLEVKRPGEDETQLQQKVHREIGDACGAVAVVRSVEDVERVLAKLLAMILQIGLRFCVECRSIMGPSLVEGYWCCPRCGSQQSAPHKARDFLDPKRKELGP